MQICSNTDYYSNGPFTPDTIVDCHSVETLYTQMNGLNWLNGTFNTSAMCTNIQIGCITVNPNTVNSKLQINSIVFTNNNMTGTIPASLNFTQIQRGYFDNNDIHGTIPPSFATLFSAL